MKRPRKKSPPLSLEKNKQTQHVYCTNRLQDSYVQRLEGHGLGKGAASCLRLLEDVSRHSTRTRNLRRTLDDNYVGTNLDGLKLRRGIEHDPVEPGPHFKILGHKFMKPANVRQDFRRSYTEPFVFNIKTSCYCTVTLYNESSQRTPPFRTELLTQQGHYIIFHTSAAKHNVNS